MQIKSYAAFISKSNMFAYLMEKVIETVSQFRLSLELTNVLIKIHLSAIILIKSITNTFVYEIIIIRRNNNNDDELVKIPKSTKT